MTKTFTQLTKAEESTLMVVDSLNLAFRYKHSGAVGFCTDYMRTVDSLKKSYKTTKLIITGDMGSSSYRKALSPIYKQNRKDKFADQTEDEKEAFEAFFAEVQEILACYEEEGVYPVARYPGVEADDIAAYIVSQRKKYALKQIWLISSDKDWDLLVAPGVSRFSYVTRKEVTDENWAEHYECTQEEYVSIKCLMGDSGDNVLGVPGVGPKRALQLIQEYGSAYDIIANLPISSRYKYITALNEFGAEGLMLNYKLMDLVTYCEEAIGEENCRNLDSTLESYLT